MTKSAYASLLAALALVAAALYIGANFTDASQANVARGFAFGFGFTMASIITLKVMRRRQARNG